MSKINRYEASFSEIIIESLISEENLRKNLIEYLVKLIKSANRVNPNYWGTTIFKHSLALNIGTVYFFWINNKNVLHVLLEKVLIKQDLLPTLQKNSKIYDNNMTWQANSLKNCRKIDKIWATINFEEINDIFIRNQEMFLASQISLMKKAYNANLHGAAKKAFSPGVVKYLNKLKYDIPFPKYWIIEPNYQKSSAIIFNDEFEEEIFEEGKLKKIFVNRFERNKKARDACIKLKGSACIICLFDFKKKYGEIGKNYIHVHHLIPLAMIKDNYKIIPSEDLIPVCPNCHAMIHKLPEQIYTVKHLRRLLLSIDA